LARTRLSNGQFTSGPERPIWERFWEKVNITETCWLWTASVVKGAYGHFGLRHGTMVYAHRFLYEQIFGPVPVGMELDHLCRTPACVNPFHLEPVTHQENTSRGDVGNHNKSRVHCLRGHPFDEVNTYIDPRGKRQCRACRRLRERCRLE